MADKDNRVEILLESIKSDVKLVLEGHAVLDHKIEEVKKSIKEVDAKVVDTNTAVKEISRTLKEHLRQPHLV